MITPRVTRLLRAPDLRGAHQTILAVLPGTWHARSTAIVLPTRSAAEELRRTIENTALDQSLAHASGGVAAVERRPVVLLPDLVTRTDLYVRLHAGLPDAPPLLSHFDREVLLRLAAGDAQREGVEPPFRLRPGLLGAILDFYDELRCRGQSIDTFDRLVRSRLEPGSDSDRGAARLLDQTRFLSATFSAFERRAADSGRIDEHGLRALLLASAGSIAYRHIIICVADQAADPRGLWPVDFDLLARVSGLERLDVVATERALAAGFHQRVHDALPGLVEERRADDVARPVLLTPRSAPTAEPALHFLCRDREEELVEAARWLKQRVGATAEPLDRTAIVFQRPLPYLYLARQVLGSGHIPYQAIDALPLASEPFAAGLDLIFTVLTEEATRSSLVELLGSPQFTFSDLAADGAIGRPEAAALDRLLRESKYLGGWDRLRQIAAIFDANGMRASADASAAVPSASRSARSSTDRDAARSRRSMGAMAAAVAVASELEAIVHAPAASEQLDRLLTFVTRHERTPTEEAPGLERHLRARAAVLGALTMLREAHARYDDRPLVVSELVATVRRWVEEQTFAPRTGREGVVLLDVAAAAFADVDAVRLVGLVEQDWPERTATSIFYPTSVLRDLGWPPEAERLAAARARFQDLLLLPRAEISVSSFTLEDDALVSASPFLDDLTGASLTIERIDRSSPRMFAHEALAIEPVVAEAVNDRAREWLGMRLGRSPATDPGYHGRVGSQTPTTYAVSRVERYLACPFKYFAGHVLQLEEERDDESGLTAQERGQLLHGVFERFFVAWRNSGGTTITAETVDRAVALFADVAESQLEGLPEADRALERTYLLGSAASPGLAERAFAFEIEHGSSVIERFVEYPFDGTFRFEGADGVRAVNVRGKADRIDLLADGTLRVVDYKLGRAPKPGRALQLPVYGVCARQQLQGHGGRSWSLARVGYVAFREKNPFIELGGRAGNLEEALRDGTQRFVEAIDGIEAGDFPVNPDEPWLCTRCGFPQVCRKDYVGDE